MDRPSRSGLNNVHLRAVDGYIQRKFVVILLSCETQFHCPETARLSPVFYSSGQCAAISIVPLTY